MEKIWLKSYPKGVPSEINPEAYSSIADLFDQSVKKYADLPMVSNLGTRLTYKDVDQKATEFAAYLKNDLSLKKGDRFAIMLPNLIQYFIAIFAAFKVGLVVVNVNPLYTKHELAHQLTDCGAETILVLSTFAKTVQDALDKTKLKNVIITEVGDAFSSLKGGLVNLVVKHVKKMVPQYNLPNAIYFKQALNAGSKLSFEPTPLSPADIAFLQYTGGTTGRSKGAMLTHRNMIANVEQASNWVAPFLDLGKERIITALPLYHIFSLTANCLIFSKIGGENILITNPRDMKTFCKTLKKNHFTGMTGVNTLFNAIVNRKMFESVDFSSLKLVLGGGMAVQEAVAKEWKEMTGTPIIEAYGLTETSPAVTINPIMLKDFSGSIGLPVPSVDIKIIDADENELPLGEVGELCVKGPQVMKGYWNAPEETKKVLSDDGWLKTGDIARVDKAGMVYIVDRKKDMVDVSGFNVYPNEVEDILVKHPAVIEAAVVGITHKKTGEALKAFVVTNEAELKTEDLISFCRQHLTPYKIPRIYEFRDELPKSNVGKILRRVLRDGEKVNV